MVPISRTVNTLWIPSKALILLALRPLATNVCRADEYRKKDAKEKEAMTLEEQQIMFKFMEKSIYSVYIPMIKFMIGTACRCSEMTGLTWNDIDMRKRTVSINHQLIYKAMGRESNIFSMNQRQKGKRVIPMTNDVYDALHEQKNYSLHLEYFAMMKYAD